MVQWSFTLCQRKANFFFYILARACEPWACLASGRGSVKTATKPPGFGSQNRRTSIYCIIILNDFFLIILLIYNAPLLEALDQPDLPLSSLGFADDVNLLMYGEVTAVNCTNLEAAHKQCLDWARMHGMRFAPNKYTLTHLTRRRCFDLHAPVRLQGVVVEPEPVVRILGLHWSAYEKAVCDELSQCRHRDAP